MKNTGKQISPKDLHPWLILKHCPGLGPQTLKQLLKNFKTPQTICSLSSKELSTLGCSQPIIHGLTKPNNKLISNELTWAAEPNHHLICWGDKRFPPLLKEIQNPPFLLYIKGDPKLLTSPQIAIVGSRNPSYSGKELAASFATQLSDAGLSITSGLALGIDAIAHQTTLMQKGKTIAVLGGGINRLYPAKNRKLADKISENGAIISEFPLSTQPKAKYFPQRNRIISGLSLGTLVIEAAKKSGSLITAQLAAEQGREVFAIPSSIFNPLSRGCHLLIKQGAKLVESIDDILEEIPIELIRTKKEKSSNIKQSATRLDQDHQKLLECIDFEMTSVEQIIERSGFSTQAVSSMLLILELEGYAQQQPGGYRKILT